MKDEELNTVITVNDKTWLFVERDPWAATLVRWYWFDWWLMRAGMWLRKATGRA